MPGQLRVNPLSPMAGEGAQQVMQPRPSVRMPGLGQRIAREGKAPGQEMNSPGANVGLQSGMNSDADRLEEQFETLKSREGTINRVLSGLGKLMDLGDTVTPGDVTERASGFVGAGLSPQKIAMVLSKMPVDSQEALASWVEQYYDQVMQGKAALDKELAAVGHELATSGMRMLLLSHVQEKSGGVAAPPTGEASGASGASPGLSPEASPEQSPGADPGEAPSTEQPPE